MGLNKIISDLKYTLTSSSDSDREMLKAAFDIKISTPPNLLKVYQRATNNIRLMNQESIITD